MPETIFCENGHCENEFNFKVRTHDSRKLLRLCYICHDAYQIGATLERGRKRLVKISVRGGVAEVTHYPEGVTVKIKDHDQQG